MFLGYSVFIFCGYATVCVLQFVDLGRERTCNCRRMKFVVCVWSRGKYFWVSRYCWSLKHRSRSAVCVIYSANVSISQSLHHCLSAVAELLVFFNTQGVCVAYAFWTMVIIFNDGDIVIWLNGCCASFSVTLLAHYWHVRNYFTVDVIVLY